MSDANTSTSTLSKRTAYQREYCKSRYSADPEYRERKLERCRQRYQRRTKECQKCGGSIQAKTLLKAENSDSPVCRKCYATEHPKTMGRPRRKSAEAVLA